ncbi:MAG: hypothetical protein ABIQ33_00740 [Caldimonas sp.]
MPLSDAQWNALARELSKALARARPDWTDANTHDPGITIVELLAFSIAELSYRRHTLSPKARSLLGDVADRAAALATALAPDDGTGGEGSGLRRVRYFFGQRLDVDDLQVEQEYLLDRLARRNRLLYGAGIVDGLAVTVEGDAGALRVVIAPGLAFDPRGREIFLGEPCGVALPASGDALLVQLSYRERPCRDVPAAADGSTSGVAATQPSRIVETFDARLAPTPAPDAVGIARVRRLRGRWRVDAKFTPPRVR